MIKVYNGLKFGKMTVISLNNEKTKSNKTNAKVYNIMCECGKTKTMTIGNIVNNIKSQRDVSCGMCYTFEDWCKDNNHQDYLDLWDCESNDKTPSEIGHRNSRKYYFKCSRGIHDSEPKRINDYTTEDVFNHSIICNKCNSFGQYLLDEYGDKAIQKYWSNRNLEDPFKIARHKIAKVFIKCQNCGSDKEIYCSNFIRQGLGCVCSSKNSYPNKFIHSMLVQLGIKSKPEKSFKWSKNKKYDEYIKFANCIIENHGMQHYSEKHNWVSVGGRSLKQEQSNDLLKEQLAIDNGIRHYIVLDCRFSELEWIKNSVMSSDLPKILNFKEYDIDWFECERFSLQSTLYYICEIWNSNRVKSTKDVISITGLDRTTILDYLHLGNELGICNYNPKDEMKKSQLRTSMMKRVPVNVYKDNVLVASFESISDVSKNSKDVLGVKLVGDIVSMACRGKRNPVYKGFTFEFA